MRDVVLNASAPLATLNRTVREGVTKMGTPGHVSKRSGTMTSDTREWWTVNIKIIGVGHHSSSGSSAKTRRTPSPHFLLSASKYGSPTSMRRRCFTERASFR